ncbi:phage virion morphogenesis protein [Paraburkholderia bonniea]|uniref:phage virion morphogenesis protein n=1 Tax=Paraburkholderia bonniea TaxID=2152891 RepID=UPI0012911980|nr:phage virion morphogenesis protein [Paraburkholderia bonniea]
MADVTDNLQALETWATALLAKLSPAQRRTAMRDVARALRTSQRTRIASQQNPDGSAYEPRKTRKARAPKNGKKLREKKGRIKRAAMFKKIRTARYLRTETSASGIAVGFSGPIAQIARIHQEGMTAPVAPGGPEYRYPARAILGFTEAERELIRDRLLGHFTPDK